jgi:quinol monooxygenase YgiN
MIAIVATLRIKEGASEQFEEVFGRLSENVRANEPGNLVYQLCRARSDETTYKVLEIYRDEDALEAHRSAEHFRAAGPDLAATLSDRPDIEYLDAIGKS